LIGLDEDGERRVFAQRANNGGNLRAWPLFSFIERRNDGLNSVILRH
jgi:hypothetical protein